MGGPADNIPWDTYARLAQTYLDRGIFQNTPMTGEMLSNAAKKAYEQYNTLVPLELALAQGQFESHMGTKGRSPGTNPYNVGEYDAGTVMQFPDTETGVQAYYNLIANNYLKDKQLDELLGDFVNTEGNRYASDPEYEEKLVGQIDFIRKFLKMGGK